MRIVMVMLWLGIAGGGCARSTVKAAPPRVHHVVLCWLKDSGNGAQREQLLAASRAFGKIPGVLEVRAGVVLPSPRPIVDDSFDVGVYFSFASVREMQNYVRHPAHQRVVSEQLMPLLEKIVIYDFVEDVP